MVWQGLYGAYAGQEKLCVRHTTKAAAAAAHTEERYNIRAKPTK